MMKEIMDALGREKSRKQRQVYENTLHVRYYIGKVAGEER